MMIVPTCLACDKCGDVFCHYDVLSWNSFGGMGETAYTDGRTGGGPGGGSLLACRSCSNLFWVDDLPRLEDDGEDRERAVEPDKDGYLRYLTRELDPKRSDMLGLNYGVSPIAVANVPFASLPKMRF